MTLPGRPRQWLFTWLVLLVPLWLLQLEDGRQQRLWFTATPPMCTGLPDYEKAAAWLPAEPSEVVFFTDAPNPQGGERFFCAQYDLAPHALKRWLAGVPRPGFDLDRLVLVAHLDDPRSFAAMAGPILAAAERRGMRVERHARPDGVTVVSLHKER